MSAHGEADVARHWDRIAGQWSRQLRDGMDVAREQFHQPAFLEFVGPLSGLSVLDAGCGDGHATRELARRGARVTGLDLSPEMIRLARAEEAAAPLGIRYEAGSYTDLARFGPGSFDRVISFMALMDGPELERAFAQIFSVLRPGGALCFAVAHPCFFTPGMEWRGLKSKLHLRVSGYFQRASGLRQWSFPPARKDAPLVAPRFLRPLSDYLNGLCESGFRIAAVAEPQPTEKSCTQFRWLWRWRRHAAMFLHVRATKPG